MMKAGYRRNRLQRNDSIDPFRNLLHPAKSLKPMKKMLLQEVMHLVVVAKLSAALVKMLNPVEACILNLRRKAALNSTALDVSYKHTGSIQPTNVLL
jgi:hypothetical protein